MARSPDLHRLEAAINFFSHTCKRLFGSSVSTVPGLGAKGAGSVLLPPGRVEKRKTRHRAPLLSFATWAGSKRQDAAPCPRHRALAAPCPGPGQCVIWSCDACPSTSQLLGAERASAKAPEKSPSLLTSITNHRSVSSSKSGLCGFG
jgi:hypothetical protein